MGTMNEKPGYHLLSELELILCRDPLIDEVGFIHPSQLAILHPQQGKDPSAYFGGDTQKSTDGGRNIGIAFQNLLSEGFSGQSNFPVAEESDTETSRELSYDRSVFWSGDHKLAISIEVLVPLYKTAKSAFLSAYQQYKSLVGFSQNEHHFPFVCEPEGSSKTVGEHRHTLDLKSIENELMNHSKVVVLLSCDYASAWNSRKRVISQKPLKEVYWEELQLSALVLSYAPKSEQAWSYRYWLIRLVINGILDPKEVLLILERESDFVEHIVERSHMNYRAWKHRCKLVNHMSTPQVLNELHRTKKWVQSHVGDASCCHYRRCLLLQLQQRASYSGKLDMDFCPDDFYRSFQNVTKGDWGEIVLMWKEELDWNKNLITHYFGREALWIHRRFLFHEMIQQAGFHYNHTSSSATDCNMDPEEVPKYGQCHQPVPLYLFLEEEFQFIDLCINNSDDNYEDTCKQKENAAMYKMWMIMHLLRINGSQELLERVEKERIKLKVILENVCPQRTVLCEEYSQSESTYPPASNLSK